MIQASAIGIGSVVVQTDDESQLQKIHVILVFLTEMNKTCFHIVWKYRHCLHVGKSPKI